MLVVGGEDEVKKGNLKTLSYSDLIFSTVLLFLSVPFKDDNLP